MNQKIKDYLGIAGLLGILVAIIIGWRFVGAYADSIQPGSYRSFSVSGDGKSVAVPDIASFTFSVLSEGGKDLATLQSQNSDKTNKAIAFLKAQNVDDKDIKTAGYDVSPRYQYSNCGLLAGSVCPPATIVGYTITQTVSVKVRDLKKAGDIISGVVASGANNVSQLSFTLDNPDSAKAAARSDAFEKAKAKAEEIAREGGFSLGRLLSVSVSDGNNSPVYYGMGASAVYDKAVPAPAPVIQAGSQDVNVTVSLTYEIK